MIVLENYTEGSWKAGRGQGTPLMNPETGEQVASASSEGVDFGSALRFAREKGSRNLQRMTYAERAALLGKIADLLAQNRSGYFEISRANLGGSDADASFDVDGAIYTLKQYAKLGAGLTGRMLVDDAVIPLSKSGAFQAQHYLKPLEGAAVFINAFNFPAWGLWEKAAPALLSGVAVLVKPATPTAWLTQQMVKDVVEAGILPEGAISIVCGSARDLLDHLRENDIVSFTGSAQTAAAIRSHPNVIARSVRFNVEADSLNATILGEDVKPDSELFSLFAAEAAKEMTLKAGQKCTAIRRVIVPRHHADAVVRAVSEKLAAGCGPVVNRAQHSAALDGIEQLKRECEVAFTAESSKPKQSCFVPPTLLLCKEPLRAKAVHEVEVFGPVATLMPYSGVSEAVTLANMGQGSLVASVFSDDPAFLATVSLGIASQHGRIMAVTSAVGKQHTGHGNVVPTCIHGGPGRAGGGEELGGLRALQLYHRRFVVQGPPDLLNAITQS
ncbi:MAG: 3,4-dehydroadipyl-CoA semialdehyde dehydrogenase [Acidobacteriales bacterium]|nr:3,4-dehydroadipyl-CoA semialdehyde dehydrogenase [Terriglobales bacterium]